MGSIDIFLRESNTNFAKKKKNRKLNVMLNLEEILRLNYNGSLMTNSTNSISIVERPLTLYSVEKLRFL